MANTLISEELNALIQQNLTDGVFTNKKHLVILQKSRKPFIFMTKRLFNGLSLFGKAFHATRREIWVSLKVLAIVTIIFALAMFLAERPLNPDYSFWDALVWTFVKYVEDPADIVDAPVTVFGKIVGTLVGVLGIAILCDRCDPRICSRGEPGCKQ